MKPKVLLMLHLLTELQEDLDFQALPWLQLHDSSLMLRSVMSADISNNMKDTREQRGFLIL